jgi:hypothetical protein
MRVDGMAKPSVPLLTNVRNQPEARISVITVTCRTVKPMTHITIPVMVTVIVTVISTIPINTTVIKSTTPTSIRVNEKLVTKMKLMTVNLNTVVMLIITIMMTTI